MSARVQGELIKPAHPPERLKALRLKNQVYRVSDEGDLEKRCSKCKDYWPADREFFFSAGKAGDGLTDWCKACYVEWRYPNGRGSVDHKFQARAA